MVGVSVTVTSTRGCFRCGPDAWLLLRLIRLVQDPQQQLESTDTDRRWTAIGLNLHHRQLVVPLDCRDIVLQPPSTRPRSNVWETATVTLAHLTCMRSSSASKSSNVQLSLSSAASTGLGCAKPDTRQNMAACRLRPDAAAFSTAQNCAALQFSGCRRPDPLTSLVCMKQPPI